MLMTGIVESVMPAAESFVIKAAQQTMWIADFGQWPGGGVPQEGVEVFFEKDEGPEAGKYTPCRIRLASKPTPDTHIGMITHLGNEGASAFLFSAQHFFCVFSVETQWQARTPPQPDMLVYFENNGETINSKGDTLTVAFNVRPIPASATAYTDPVAVPPPRPQPPPIPQPPPVPQPPMPNTFAQVPFGQTGVTAATFAANPENRCPILLLLDTSFSMDGAPIAELNQALQQFAQDLQADSLAAKRAEIAIATFGPVQTVCDFVTADSFYPPTLVCTGDTPLGAALLHGIDMVTQRKALYKANGIMYYRPKIFLLTDGAPTDDWQAAADAVKGGEVTNDFSFYPIGVQGADMAVLQQIATITPLRLKGLQFREMFAWLSASISAVSRSMPGDEVALENPATPSGWATF